ncbi:MAG: GAF domain-containing protein, partial [Candidatus Micrarchaeota archaeon]
MDDDSDVPFITKRSLCKYTADFEMYEANSGDDALEQIEKNNFDCLLVDYDMPGMNGLELLSELRAQGNEVPVVFLTGQGNEEVVVEALRGGASDYFVKGENFVLYQRIANSIIEAVEKRQVSKALAESENKFRGLVEHTEELVWQMDRNAVFTYVNPMVRELIGYEPEEVIGRSLFDFKSTEEAKKASVLFSAFASKQERIVAREHTFLHKDGHPVLFETNASPIFDALGDICGYSGASRDITERKQAEKKARDIARLHIVGKIFSSKLHLKSILEQIVDEAVQITGFERCSLKLLDEEKKGLVVAATVGLGDEYLRQRGTIPLGTDISGMAFAEKKPFWTRDVETDERIHFTPAAIEYLCRRLGLHSYLAVPILYREKALGTLSVMVKGFHDFTPDEIDMLTSFAGYAAFAIENARLYDERAAAISALRKEERRVEKEMTAISSVLNNILSGDADEAQIERRVLDACIDATDSVYGMIGIINSRGRYDVTTYTGKVLMDCAFPEALSWKLSRGMKIRGIWGFPMLQGTALLCNDLEAHSARVGLPEEHVPIQCFLGVPLRRNGKVSGLVAVANKPGGYAEKDKDILTRLASIVSLSRQHKQTLDREKKTSTDLKGLIEKRMLK